MAIAVDPLSGEAYPVLGLTELKNYEQFFDIADWVLDAGFYTLIINHQLETQKIYIQILEGNNFVTLHRLEILDDNRVKFYVGLTCRFMGKVTILT